MSLKMRNAHRVLDEIESILSLRLSHMLSPTLRLSERDWQTYRSAIVLWFCYNHDLGILDLSNTLIWRVLNSICEISCTTMISFLKQVDESLIIWAQSGRFEYESFKRSLTNTDLKTIFSVYKGVIKNKELTDIEKFKDCHTSCLFFSRLSLRDREDLQARAQEDYIKENDHIFLGSPEEADVISRWFPRTVESRYRITKALCDDVKHGPGATADCGRYLCSKYSGLHINAKQRMLVQRSLVQEGVDPHAPFYRLMRGAWETTGNRPLQTDSIAKVVFVPKTATKLRTICMEPAGTMFLEQAIQAAILDIISSRGHELHRRINLEDQSLNRDLAWEGSLSGSFATIDLSAASDSVSWELIAHWFDSTALREVVTSLRSNKYSVGGETYYSNKFAPMGSALCFPIECIVFCAIVEVAITLIGAQPCDSRYRVYGDDIIVETAFAEAVMAELKRNGFKVNAEKSYYSKPGTSLHYYRESCGGEYIDGFDVTPRRLSRRYHGFDDLTPSQVQAFVDMCNEFYDCKVLRSRVIGNLRKVLSPAQMPVFDSTGEAGIFSPSPTNFHKERVYSEDYQHWYLLHARGFLKARKRADDDVAYLATLHALESSRRKTLLYPEDKISVSRALQTKEVWVTSYRAD